MPFTSTDYPLIPIALTLVVFLVVLAVLALLTPLFVYQIRNDMRRTAQSLDELNTNIMRALSSGSPASGSAATRAASPASTAADLESFPVEASMDATARTFGVIRK